MTKKRAPKGSDAAESQVARVAASRAIRRLGLFENVALATAAITAMLGGWVLAYLLSRGAGLPFRPSWLASSFLLFAIPALFFFLRERKERGRAAPGINENSEDS